MKINNLSQKGQVCCLIVQKEQLSKFLKELWAFLEEIFLDGRMFLMKRFQHIKIGIFVICVVLLTNPLNLSAQNSEAP